MGLRNQKRHRATTKSQTLPSSPNHSSSSSSEFEFTIAVSPRKSSADLRPADELFYKGQLLPLHLSPRLSMVRTLLLSSSSTSSSSDTTTTASRDSTASNSSSSSCDLLHHLDCDSSRPSSATDDELKTLTHNTNSCMPINSHSRSKPSKYFSLPKFTSVFRKTNTAPPSSGGASVKRVSSSAKEVIRKYFKKVKPFYEKLSQKQHHQKAASPPSTPPSRSETTAAIGDDIHTSMISHSFSGNLRYPRGRNCFASCPSSMGSSPSHGRTGSGYVYGSGSSRVGWDTCSSETSSMEELQNAIQGAILHCKNSMLQNKTLVSKEM